MEIFSVSYICNRCGCGVEAFRSVNLDVPCVLKVGCPECQGMLELFEVNRLYRDDENSEVSEDEN